MHLHIGISPCPNDTFIFENIYNQKVVIAGITFEFHFHDVEELNQLAAQGKLDIVKISYAQYFNVKDKFRLLRSGGAMGFGVGPLLVKKAGNIFIEENASVVIPGVHTTANFLLSQLYPAIKNKTPLLFSEIESVVLSGQYDAGLLIHEGRFTYQEKGLEKIADLGELWQQKMNLPIPLGCIVAKKSLPEKLVDDIERLVKYSISNYDTNGQPILSEFIKQHAQEMDEAVMMQHIQLYVNEFSKDVGVEGEKVIALMEELMG